MPKVEQTVNLLDDQFKLVTLQHGDEIPSWAVSRFDPKSFCACETVPAPIIPEVNTPQTAPQPDDSTDYSKLDKKALAALCAERELAVDGNKPDLVARLVEHDAAAASGEHKDEEVDVWGLDVAELTALAKERGVDIGDASGTEEIAALLEQAEQGE